MVCRWPLSQDTPCPSGEPTPPQVSLDGSGFRPLYSARPAVWSMLSWALISPNKTELWRRDGPAKVSLDMDDHGPQPLELFPQEWVFLGAGAALFVQCYSKSHLQGGPGSETHESWHSWERKHREPWAGKIANIRVF